MNNNIPHTLEKIVEKSGLEQDKFAETLGLKKAAFNNYIKGRRELPKRVITLLMEKHNVNPQIFFDENAPMYIRNIVNEENENQLYDFEKISSIELPLYGSVAAGALAEVEGVTTSNVEYISMPRKFLGKYSNCADMFAMTVNGESMNKLIKNESIVIAKPMNSYEYKDGDIVIFSYNNEYSLKRFSPNELEEFILFKSESTDKAFKDIPVPKDTLNDLKIYGKVVFYGTTL